jgi:hypothetical protein
MVSAQSTINDAAKALSGHHPFCTSLESANTERDWPLDPLEIRRARRCVPLAEDQMGGRTALDHCARKAQDASASVLPHDRWATLPRGNQID